LRSSIPAVKREEHTNMLLRPCFRLIWLFSLSLWMSCLASAQALSDCKANPADGAHRSAIEAAKKFWRDPLKIDLRREGQGFPDGAKGETMQMTFVPLPPPPHADRMTRTEIEDAMFRIGYCNATAIIRATPVCERAEITPDFTAIYTRTRLRVHEVIASSKLATFKDDIFVTNFGGEVKDQGEVIRLEWIFDGVPTRLRIGAEYLLMLHPLKGAGVNDFTAQAPVAISNGKLDQHALKWYLFRGGESIADARARLQRTVSATCPAVGKSTP
jgi:hypothetical protein